MRRGIKDGQGDIDVGSAAEGGAAERAHAWSLPLSDRLGSHQAILRSRLIGTALVGGLAAAGVGYLASLNPRAAPAEFAVGGRVTLVLVLIAAGLYAQISRLQPRMGRLLDGAGLVIALSLLNAANEPFLFSIGLLVSGFVPIIISSLLLTHPSGRLRSSRDLRFLTITGGVAAILWIALVLITRHPALQPPLLACAPHCPSSVFFLGFDATGVVAVLKPAVVGMWIVLTWGTCALLARRARASSPSRRRSVAVVIYPAIAYAGFLTAFFGAQLAGLPVTDGFHIALLVISIAVPLAVVVGLGLERLWVARALADFVTRLVEQPRTDPQALMASALHDPSLQIAYRTPGLDGYVDSWGVPVSTESPGPDRAITWVERDHSSIAAVIYDSELSDNAQFVQAAGAASSESLERVRLQAKLTDSTARLAASRARLVETAYVERKLIERDLHDSIQQDIVALRIKLDAVAEAMREEPSRGERMITMLGRQVDDVLGTLRSLAGGIYPALLDEQGLAEALKSVALRSPLPVSVVAGGVNRYAKDVEIAVYFCCLEALQNSGKHAGPDARGSIRLWREPNRLCFEVTDSGVGFEPEEARLGHGLVNMRDRIEAVGGSLTISAPVEGGTLVHGDVPIPDVEMASATIPTGPAG